MAKNHALTITKLRKMWRRFFVAKVIEIKSRVMRIYNEKFILTRTGESFEIVSNQEIDISRLSETRYSCSER